MLTLHEYNMQPKLHNILLLPNGIIRKKGGN